MLQQILLVFLELVEHVLNKKKNNYYLIIIKNILLSSSAKSTRFPLRRLDLSVSSLLKSSKISLTSRSSRRAKKKQKKLFYFFPGESIRPADPVVFDRIRIGFHRNPTFFIKN